MTEPIEVLLVEDNPADADLTCEKLEAAKIRTNMHIVGDGIEALRFLRREDKYIQAPRPALILLDLNLPRKDGREVLDEIKRDPTLRRIPVVILTSSEAERDIIKSYNLGANAYITKPVDLQRFSEIVRAIEDFWFAVVKLPKD